MRTTSSRHAPPIRRRAILATCVAVALAASALPGAALAQTPSAVDVAQARDLFNEGMRLREKGDIPAALDKLKAANALAHTPITGLELARVYEQTGQLVEAREALLGVAREPPLPNESVRSKEARAEALTLAENVRARIPTLTVKVTGVPPATVAVSIDGASVLSEALDAPRPVDPGSHNIFARSTSGGTAQTTVDLKEGENRLAELKIAFASGSPPEVTPASSTAPRPSSPPSGEGTVISSLVYVGVGVAAAGLVVGGVTGTLALAKADSVNKACNGTTCPPSASGDVQTGRTFGDVSTVSFVVAGAGAVAGVIGLFLSHPRVDDAPTGASFEPWIAPGSAGLRGWF
jgi:hypothetical protein